MDDQFLVEPSELRGAGAELERIAERLNAEWSGFLSRAQARGDIFGDDSVGGLIGMSYQAAQEIIGKCYGSAVEAFAGFGQGLATMADGYEEIEQAHVEMFRRLGR
jgi:uncharacterized protein YukE